MSRQYIGAARCGRILRHIIDGPKVQWYGLEYCTRLGGAAGARACRPG